MHKKYNYRPKKSCERHSFAVMQSGTFETIFEIMFFAKNWKKINFPMHIISRMTVALDSLFAQC